MIVDQTAIYQVKYVIKAMLNEGSLFQMKSTFEICTDVYMYICYMFCSFSVQINVELQEDSWNLLCL